MRRSRRSAPYTSSPSTQSHGTPASSARATISRAIAGLVRNGTSSGTLAARRRSASPAQGLRQVEPAVDQRVPPAAAVGQEHADLTVLDLAQRAAVLPRHAGRVAALLHEAALVDDQHRVLGAQAPDRVLAAEVAGRLLVPQHVAEHPLRAPRPRVADRLRELP